MKRFFGMSKTAPAPTLDEATKRVSVILIRLRSIQFLDMNIGGLDDKIRKLDQELAVYRQQIKNTRPGPAQNGIKAKAMRVMKQKKMYEAQRDQLSQQSFNMEQTKFATQSMQDTVTMVSAMKQGAKEMKQQFKHINVDDVDSLQDEMQDLLDFNNDLQQSMSRAYTTPDSLDESELEAELMSMDDELELEDTPSYLIPSAPTTEPSAVDEYGLPEHNHASVNVN
ncbi:SNF7 family protein [Heterostelium album PN500]|uniref:SNF7 family protein n=1 Tax=Heterostelium pallidum (strain ATCC 26659 / Pp 5 / PN500) TaxID=670386 RepID=D3B7S7_HETP5|nr:SNF7 family protein [Heterostelium album PN500]EFA82820.1 SNF7 family protein [Heterostelium album PN500]|eukprot:XP_020434937.1 SNF7 family protein [Heterostelium album PN500]